jgi:glycosyltransferase involved in cell wall biosynthesis
MNRIRVIYIDYNFIEEKYPNKPKDGDSWFTHGFGGLFSRKQKKFYPQMDIECWKADGRAKKQSEKTIENVKFRIFPAMRIGRLGCFSPGLLLALKKEADENPKTIINCSSFDHLLFYSLRFSGAKLPVVVQHHGESPASYKLAKSNGIKRALWYIRMQLERKSLQDTDLLYLLDPEAKEWLSTTPRHIRQLSTGVDEDLFFPISKKEARIKLGLNPDHEYLVYIGKLNSTKRPEWLIQAYEELKPKYPDLNLLIGGCSEKDPFYEKAKKAGAKLSGVIPQDQISLWMSAASIYYLPGLSENHRFGGLGMLPVQAMLCNTPVIAGTLKCFPEEAREKVGIYIRSYSELKNATIEILKKKRSFFNLRETAVPYYSWKYITAGTLKDYERIIAETCL